MANGWNLRYEGFDPAQEGLREALCTLGNGYFATRGAAPEAHADGVHNPGTYIAGCYNRLESEVSGRLVSNESLVNVPNWLPLSYAVDDGEWLDLSQVDVLEHHLDLDLRRGVLTRQTRIRDAAGRKMRIVQRRFVHMELPHVAALESTVVAENWSGRLRIRSALDGAVANTGVARYRGLPSQHLSPVSTADLGNDAILLVAETNQSHIRIALAARTRIRNGAGPLVSGIVRIGEDWVADEISVDVAPGDTVTVEKVVTVFTSRDNAISEPADAAAGLLAELARLRRPPRPARPRLGSPVGPVPRPGRHDRVAATHVAPAAVPSDADRVPPLHRSGRGRPGAWAARGGISRAHFLGRAVHPSYARPSAPRAHPVTARVPLSAPSGRKVGGSGRRSRRRDVPLAVRQRRS